eukprot:1767334-Rhodomonas_salina.2
MMSLMDLLGLWSARILIIGHDASARSDARLVRSQDSYSPHSRLWTFEITSSRWLQRTYSAINAADLTPYDACTAVQECSVPPTLNLARYGHSSVVYRGTRVKVGPIASELGLPIVLYGGVFEEYEKPVDEVWYASSSLAPPHGAVTTTLSLYPTFS